MSEGMNLGQRNREEARWRMLRVVDSGRPVPVSEQVILQVLDNLHLEYSLKQLRRELTYLRDLGLVKLSGEDSDFWFVELTAMGVDVVEYNAKSPAGIARPRKYWRDAN